MTVEKLLTLYCQSLTARNLSPNTVNWYREEVTRFLQWLRANQLHNGNWLRADIIEAYLAHCRQSCAPATVASRYRALTGFFGWLVDREYIAASPMLKVKAPAVPRSEPKRTAVEQYIQLLDSIPAGDWIDLRDRLIVTTLFLTGIRLGECTHLQPDDYRLAEHLLRVNGKTGVRLVPMIPPVERAFVAYLFLRPASASPYLLLAANGARNPKAAPLTEDGIYQMLRRRCRRAGLKMLNPHSFRHGLAMHLLNVGGDMSLVQKVLGHAQIGTTARYYAEWLTAGLVSEFSTKMRGLA
jgi:site-specific recombinase XerD